MNGRFVTKKLMNAATLAVLSEQGYDLVEDSDYIIALHPDSATKDLVIYSAARLLSKKGSAREETKMFPVSLKTVKKLKEFSENLAGDYTPCLSFGVAKYNYSDFEICIIPLSAWKNAGRGKTLSITSGGYYYNYEKADQYLPIETIARQKWK